MAAKPVIFILNGPNLNLLGTREPDIYGTTTLDAIQEECEEAAEELGVAIDFRQTNHEGELVEFIQQAHGKAAGIIINAGALTHTSIAILDALKASKIPVIEVHLSNIFRREAFRHTSYVSQAADGIICGLGPAGYVLALEAMANLPEQR